MSPTLLPMTRRLVPLVLDIEKKASSFPWRHSVTFESEIAAGNAFVLADDTTEVVGYVVVAPFDNTTLLLKKMAILPSEQNKGHGRYLLTQISALAQRQHKKTIILHVRESNRKAVTLYKQFGYKIVEKRPNYYISTGASQTQTTALFMALDLTAEEQH